MDSNAFGNRPSRGRWPPPGTAQGQQGGGPTMRQGLADVVRLGSPRVNLAPAKAWSAKEDNMTRSSISDHARTIRETTNCILVALDVMILRLNLDAGDPMAAIMELQREVVLSLGRLSETVAEVGEAQNDVLKSPEMQDAMKQAAEMGVEAGFQQVASQMRRRAWLHSCILVAAMVVGGIAGVTGFTMGSKHALSTSVADCLQKGAQLTPGGDRVCTVSTSPR